jgi:hypothetical protein
MLGNSKRSFAIIIGIILLVLLLASTGAAAWATPGQDQLRQTVPTPIPDPYVIVLPPQRNGNEYSFEFNLLPGAECAPPAGCELFSPFTLEAYLGTQLVYPVTFDPPLEICFQYTQAQADAVGGPENLAVVYWDDAQSAWIPLDNQRYDASPEVMQVCGDISFLPATSCGLGVTCAISPTGVPVTGQAAGPSPTVGRLLIVALVVGGLAGVAFARRRRPWKDS